MVRAGQTSLSAIRQDSGEAGRVVEALFPRRSERELALKILAESIICAARIGPASWGTSLFHRRLCLNVGRGAVLQFYREEILFIVTGSVLRKLPRGERSAFRFNRKYAFVTDAIEGWLSASALPRYDAFRRAHVDLIERAAQGRRVCFWPKAHSPSVVELLRQHKFHVPAPDYIIASHRESALEPDELDRVTVEGRRTLRRHLVLERKPELAKRKKENVMARVGRLACEVCGFDFEKVYGPIGHGFAEVHHLRPLGKSGGPRKVRLGELAIVCSNCHRMIHRANPVFALKELRDRLLTTSQ